MHVETTACGTVDSQSCEEEASCMSWRWLAVVVQGQLSANLFGACVRMTV